MDFSMGVGMSVLFSGNAVVVVVDADAVVYRLVDL